MSARAFALLAATTLTALSTLNTGSAGHADVTDATDAYFAASLNGANEVPAKGGPKTGDRDGSAYAVIRVSGDEVSYAVRWKGVATPTAFHVHQGTAGANGAVKAGFFAGALPRTASAVSGTVRAGDAALAGALAANPTGFYLNLHSAEFPGGAVRGQLHRLDRAVSLAGVLIGPVPAPLRALADARQEVPTPGKRTGDRDGGAEWLIRPQGTTLHYAAAWSRVDAPTNGHVHRGAPGVNGPVVADLFAAANGLPASVNGIAGSAPVDRRVAAGIRRAPGNWYANLHTKAFDGGAVRGRLAPALGTQPRAVLAPVVRGTQVYACTRQDGGGHAYTQLGVAARLDRSIAHSFVRPAAGPPQWVAPDGSAVTGKVVTKTANGAGNIPELLLDATQTGGDGLLGRATLILRLNTAGGVAPAGPCDPASRPTVRVPYRSDYLYLG
ncbi:CHRD domain-containing protein [Spongiactinospora sp. TRM90649]|uniref:CHRD domain-containing protein n=1 Tax=Spongiactinospora sp. TRM90649 TaxID=3031114 RepID=UPI0023F9976C|nr:CHRD domain-containing protein [Spongiactinospora sp. TRM90649]MDF5757874.1 CHRD domain-containing protein [Spongiactinospora sp. TRM90649]